MSFVDFPSAINWSTCRSGDTRTKVGLSARNLLDRLDQIAGYLILQNVAFHSCFQRLGDVLIFVMLCEED